jgi:hypothetical protein
MNLTEKEIVAAAIGACRSFAKYSPCFFNFQERAAWLGWENWLTVEIARRLDSLRVIPFFTYPKKRLRRDLFVRDDQLVAVEVKTNYITDKEASRENRSLPDRVTKDVVKMRMLDGEIGKLILLATVLDSAQGLAAYKSAVKKDLAKTFVDFRPSWHDCSSGKGHVLLLALFSNVRKITSRLQWMP